MLNNIHAEIYGNNNNRCINQVYEKTDLTLLFALSYAFLCLMRKHLNKKTNIHSHLPLVVSSHAGSLGFICPSL